MNLQVRGALRMHRQSNAEFFKLGPLPAYENWVGRAKGKLRGHHKYIHSIGTHPAYSSSFISCDAGKTEAEKS